jgi:glyoxylase-like metal-dependent hydrolase (beta-lactamase superfamily II)
MSADAPIPTLELGTHKLHRVDDGFFKLDGGAMFGVVPKTLWSKAMPADEDNRIRMGSNCLLVEKGADLVLIDTGLGGHADEKFRGIYAYGETAGRLPQEIRRAGFELGDVTHVVLSHLHFDHCGWNCTDGPGGLVPTFPKARYWMSRGEVEHARAPNQRDRASYFPRNWEPLFEAGVAELFDGQGSPIEGVTAIEAPGHNRNMCVVRVDGGASDAQAIFLADLVPTVAHVPYPWVMGYDLYPLETLAGKEHWLPQAAAGGWLCHFEHEPDTPWARLVADKPGRFKAAALR